MTEREHPPLTESDIVWLPDAEDGEDGMVEPEDEPTTQAAFDDDAEIKRRFNAKVRELEGKNVVELAAERDARDASVATAVQTCSQSGRPMNSAKDV